VKVFLRDALHSDNKNAVLFALYTLACIVALAVTAAVGLWRGIWTPSLIALCALLLPPVLLASRRVVAKREFAEFIPLAALYLVYGLARARALLNLGR
jgi:hypothetical protein